MEAATDFLSNLSTKESITEDTIENLDEREIQSASWVKRRLTGSIYGRVVMSSYETLRATGTTVICLSPWGDSSPLMLPCVRFRDLAIHAVIIGTGGVAAVASPILEHIADVVDAVLGDSYLVEIGVEAGQLYASQRCDDFDIDEHVDRVIPLHSSRLTTTDTKTLTITLRYKHTVTDALLGFFRSSIHKDNSFFSGVKDGIKDYLAIEKGWMSPYLFASNRRPIIPRSMKPDVVFCHGPFLSGDYRVSGELLKSCASIIALCESPKPTELSPKDGKPPATRTVSNFTDKEPKEDAKNAESSSSTTEPQKRRMMITVLGIKPHRTNTAWSTSLRPGQSVLRYTLMDGCPAIVIPVKTGCPLVAWHAMTLKRLYAINKEDGEHEKEEDGEATKVDEVEGKDQEKDKENKVSGEDAPATPETSLEEKQLPVLTKEPVTSSVKEETKEIKKGLKRWSTKKLVGKSMDIVQNLRSLTKDDEKLDEESQVVELAVENSLSVAETISDKKTSESTKPTKKEKKWGKKSKDASLEPIHEIHPLETNPPAQVVVTDVAVVDGSPVEDKEMINFKIGDKIKGIGKTKWMKKATWETGMDSLRKLSFIEKEADEVDETTGDLQKEEANLWNKLSPKRFLEDLKDGEDGEEGALVKTLWRKASKRVGRGVDERHKCQLKPLEKVVESIFEFLTLHVDWDRLEIPKKPTSGEADIASEVPEIDKKEVSPENESHGQNGKVDEAKAIYLKNVVGILVAAAVKTQDCERVQKDVNIERAGIAMLRCP